MFWEPCKKNQQSSRINAQKVNIAGKKKNFNTEATEIYTEDTEKTQNFLLCALCVPSVPSVVILLFIPFLCVYPVRASVGIDT
jgi:hypothetical protein